ncbi:MAG: lamin tail domain-containing protein [Bacteroidia bacterium]
MKHLAVLIQRQVLLIALFAGFMGTSHAQVVINEIFYNVPGADDFEFLELHNPGNTMINLAGYSFTQGVAHTFPVGATIAPGGYFVISSDSVAMMAQFPGVTSWQWTSGALSNGGEDVTIIDAAGVTVDSVDFEDNSGGWAEVCDGGGPSLSLCDPTTDNNLVANWGFSTVSSGTTYGDFGQEIFATPGAANGTCNTAPTIFFSGISKTVLEDTNIVTVFVQMANTGAMDTATVDISLAAGATADAMDYTIANTTIEFASDGLGGRSTTTFDVVITDDMMLEPTEFLELELTNATMGAVTMGANIVIEIQDNDGPTYYPIGTVSADSDNDFVPDSLNVVCELRGVVHGIDLQGSANNILFTIIDATGGIGAVNFGNAYGYTVTEGDSVHVWGSIGQFRGLTQIDLDTVVLISQGNAINMPAVVTALDESTESEVIRLNGVELVDPTAWPAAGSSRSVEVFIGTDTFTVRIDSDTDVDGMPAPVGAFDIAGIGGQFDTNTPADSGYQILPRYMADVMGGSVGPLGPTYYSIGTISADSDNDFVPDSLNVECELRGIVHGVDLQGNANNILFTIIDPTGGIGAVNFGNAYGYTVTEGDSVHVSGTIEQFRGLTQINLDTVVLVSQGNAINMPAVVTTLDESTESEVIRLNGVELVDPTAWPAAGSSRSVEVFIGTDTFTVRIDSDTDVDGMPAPVGAFDIAGIGGQFDTNTPADSGYQILPRYMPDVIGGGTGPLGPAYYPIGTVSADSDNDFVPDSLNVECELRGIVHGVDLQGDPNNILFTIIDGTGGIGAANFGNSYGYTVTEGDSIHVSGTIEQFRGLTQINLDTVVLISQGNAINTPAVVTALDESTESEVIRLNGVELVDPAAWPAVGNSTNVEVFIGTDTFTVRIDSDTDVDGMPVPVGTFDIAGIGGQFDRDIPADSGYQIFPRYMADVMTGGMPPMGPAYYPIGTVNADANMDFVPDSMGVECELRGVVYGVDIRGGGLQFTLIDPTDGIGTISFSSEFGYTVTEGDSVHVWGTIGQFRGLSQITMDTVILISQGNAINAPRVVTALDETTESDLIRMNGITVADPAQWPAAGSNANVDVFVGTDTFTVRIDRDSDVDGIPVPVGMFDLIGIGGQFDGDIPADSGYQIMPRVIADVIAMMAPPAPAPYYPIGTVSADSDGDFVPDSLGVACELRGVVYGVNLRPGGQQFTMVDATGGIGTFNFSNDFMYTLTEGDSVHAVGSIDQFRGLTQIALDTVYLVSQGNAINMPLVVNALGEDTESELVRINGLTLVDPTEWPMAGNSANVRAYVGTDTFTIRIDSDTDVDEMMAPVNSFDLIGIGGQFDGDTPADSGYQIFPRYMSDVMEIVGISNGLPQNAITAYPNPGKDLLILDASVMIERIEILDFTGRTLMSREMNNNNARINTAELAAGAYIIRVRSAEGAWTGRWVKL